MAAETHADDVLQLLRLVREKRFDDLEAAWMAALENDEFSLDDLRRVLHEILAQGAAKPLESLLWLLLTVWAERKGPDETIQAARQLEDFLPDSDVLREEAAGLYRKAEASAPGIAALVEMTVLRKDLPLAVAIERLEKLLWMPPGTYVSDSRRRAPGRVLAIDEARKVLAVSFGDSQRTYDAVSAENLEPGEPDDYRALLLFDRPRLEALARDDPAELARIVLKAQGPHMTFRDFKAALADVVPAEAWSKWWTGAKVQVRRSPLVEMSEGGQPTFFLRTRPMAFADRAKDGFHEVRGLQERLVLVLGHLKETGHDPAAEADLLKHFADELARAPAGPAGADAAGALAALAVVAEIGRRHPQAVPPGLPAAEAVLGSEPDMAALAGAYQDDCLAESALGYLRQALPQRWPDLLAAALPGASPDVCEWIATELAGAGHEGLLTGVAAGLMRRPEQGVAALFWLWKAVTADRFPQAMAEVNRVLLTIRFLRAADALAREATDDRALRPLVAQIRSVLGARDGAALRGVLESADDVQAKDIRAAIERNAALTDIVRSRLLDVVRQTHPSHFAIKTVPPWEEEGIVYTTTAALRLQEERYGELVTRKILENQRAIAAAAEHGDISENAEFTAALEERERLAERAASLQADIAKARSITLGMAQSETATIGSRVRARNLATGEEEILIFLGPWDTDIAKHIYYYRAPLSLAFMGKRAGDIVTFKTDSGERRWEILEVGSGL